VKPLLTELADLIQDGDTEASDILDDLKDTWRLRIAGTDKIA